MRFLQIAKSCKFAGERDRFCEISQNVQKLGFFSKDRWIFEKNLIFEKSSKLASLPKNATGIAWTFKTFNYESLGFLIKNGCLSTKLEFFEIAEGSKVAVECDWNIKISQNFQTLGFF